MMMMTLSVVMQLLLVMGYSDNDDDGGVWIG